MGPGIQIPVKDKGLLFLFSKWTNINSQPVSIAALFYRPGCITDSSVGKLPLLIPLRLYPRRALEDDAVLGFKGVLQGALI